MANTTEQQTEGAAGARALAAAPQRFLEFLRECLQELRRVTWPTPKETYQATIVVVAVVLAVSLFLGVVDFGLSWVMRQILGGNQG